MKLATLLHKHDESSTAQGLPNSFGDSYLLKHNLIYQAVRHKTLDLGFVYSDQPSPDYVAFPMGQLETLLKEKVIPYSDNVAPLKKLNGRSPDNLEWDHIVDNLKPNYVFHESCHAIARSFSISENDLSVRLTTLLIEESFANTCEFLAIAEAQDLTHRLFLEINSYFTAFEDRTVLKKAIEDFGRRPIFKFILLCYLQSNFLNERLGDNDFRRVLDLCELSSAPSHKILKSLAQNAFSLNPRFRYSTTEMYLRLNGINTSVKQALDFDYLKLITTNKNLKSLIHNLTVFISAPKDNP